MPYVIGLVRFPFKKKMRSSVHVLEGSTRVGSFSLFSSIALLSSSATAATVSSSSDWRKTGILRIHLLREAAETRLPSVFTRGWFVQGRAEVRFARLFGEACSCGYPCWKRTFKQSTIGSKLAEIVCR